MIGLHEQIETALSGRYQIERELGRGGMAIVYLARDLKHSRRVAVKVLRPELANSLGAERFLREINVAAGLSHPNIVPLYDSGEADDLLYYVMPYVEGESLRDRLERERQLPIDEAIGIARQVASALDYAHAKGVVHRDIKPENILLRGDQVLVADFGLARALYTASSSRLTRSGMAVGTPAYMSPEQASGDSHVDGRTDVYGLACVLFEMIAGVPPFRGSTAQAVIAHHVATPPPSLCEERSTCPESIAGATRRALAKVPADRYRTAGEFLRVADESDKISAGRLTPRQRVRRSRALISVLSGVAVVSAGAYVAYARSPSVDENRFVVLPFNASQEGPGAVDGVTVAHRLSEAIAEWQGTTQVDEQRTRDVLDERLAAVGGGRLRTEVAIDVARRLGAGRLVWGTTRTNADSVTIRSSLYDVRTGNELRAHTTAHLRTAQALMQYRELANAMIRARPELPWLSEADRWPASLASWTAYDSGRFALAKWSLDEATRLFRRAVTIDPGHARAQLWLAQTLTWADRPASSDERRRAAKRATDLQSRLVPADMHLARAAHALAERRFEEACDQYKRVLQAKGDEFAAWLGFGDCHARDSTVVADGRSPSGYVFRGSYYSAARAYRSAVDALTPPHPSFPYRRLAYVLFAQSNRMRFGYLAGADETWFAAYPSLSGDTLALIPFPASMVTSGAPEVIPTSLARAVAANRRVLRGVFTSWVRSSPDNPDAHERLGRLLESLGIVGDVGAHGESALSELRRAGELVSDSLRRLSLATAQVRLLVKIQQFAAAKRLADSILQSWPRPDATVADSLIGLTVLTGRVDLATRLQQMQVSASQPVIFGPDGSPLQPPQALLKEWAAVLVRASLGLCDARVRDFEQRVNVALESYYADVTERAMVRDAMLVRPMTLAAPCLGAAAVSRIGRRPERLVAMQQALSRGDFATVRAHFDTLRALRRHDRPGDVAIDYTYGEAWILTAIGDTAGAVRHLDLSLGAPATLGDFLLLDAPHAGGLLRAMVLRGEIAAKRNDARSAARWGQAVTALLADADAPVRTRIFRSLSGRR